MTKRRGLKAGLVVVSVVSAVAALAPTPAQANHGTTSTDISVSTVFTDDDNPGYSRLDARTYAQTWSSSTYASLTYYNGYYNYARDGGASGGDCTSFVSQSLRAGDFQDVGYPYNDLTHSWYYQGPNVPERSSTWTHAHFFRQFWGVVNGEGHKGAYQMRKYTWGEAMDHYDQIYGDLWPGDVVQYVDATGQTFHTQIVHSYFRDATNQPIMWMAQHSDASDPSNTWGYQFWLKDSMAERQGYATWVITLKMKQGTDGL